MVSGPGADVYLSCSEKVIYPPLLELANVAEHGPRVAESAVGLTPYISSSMPYEELRLKAKSRAEGIAAVRLLDSRQRSNRGADAAEGDSNRARERVE